MSKNNFKEVSMITNHYFCPLTIMLIAMCITFAHADTCPTPPTRTAPSVQSKVTFDPKNGQYTYGYTVSNEPNSILPIDSFVILSAQAPVEIQAPGHWDGGFINLPNLEKNITWDTSALDPSDPRANQRGYAGPPLKLFYSIKPGKSLSGFSFKSVLPPGPVKYFVEGETEVPVTVPTIFDDEPESNCPGFHEGPRFKAMLGGVTEGPMPPGTVPVSIRLLGASGEWHSHECNPDKDSGKISVLLFPSRDFDPSLLTLSSVKFGPGAAPVVSSNTLPTFKDRNDEWEDWEKSRKRIHPDQANMDNRERSKKKALFLTFDLAAVGIRCGLDKALFLEGETSDGKKIVGAVPISTRDCKPWTGKKKMEPTSRPKKPPAR